MFDSPLSQSLTRSLLAADDRLKPRRTKLIVGSVVSRRCRRCACQAVALQRTACQHCAVAPAQLPAVAFSRSSALSWQQAHAPATPVTILRQERAAAAALLNVAVQLAFCSSCGTY
jgi:hypothetical protein